MADEKKKIAKGAGKDTDTSKNHEYTDWKAVDQFVTGSWSILSSRKGRNQHGSPQTPTITKVGLPSDQTPKRPNNDSAASADPAARRHSRPLLQDRPRPVRRRRPVHRRQGAGDRKVAKEFKGLPLAEVECLLHSEIHEERLLALVILVGQFEKGDDATRKRIYDLYLANTRHINNWDLVDLSAPQIVGGYLENRSRKPLDRLAKSASLWERRISILATHWFIRHGDFADTLRIAEKLLGGQGGLDPQGGGLDAAGGREEGRGGAGGVPGRALPGDATDDAAVRHRAVPGGEAAGVPEGGQSKSQMRKSL